MNIHAGLEAGLALFTSLESVTSDVQAMRQLANKLQSSAHSRSKSFLTNKRPLSKIGTRVKSTLEKAPFNRDFSAGYGKQHVRHSFPNGSVFPVCIGYTVRLLGMQ